MEQLGFFTVADGVPAVLAAVREQLKKGASQNQARGWRSSFDPLDVAQFTFDEIKAAPSRGWAPRGGRARVGRTAARP